jgi:DnaJ-class molecular chaperone
MKPKPRPHPNHYARLEVHRGMDCEWIRNYTRALLMRAHPDRPNGNAERFALLTLSRAVLGDEHSRRQYHEQLALLAPWCTECDAVGYTTQQTGWTSRKMTACVTCGGSGHLVTDKDWEMLDGNLKL